MLGWMERWMEGAGRFWLFNLLLIVYIRKGLSNT